MINCICLNLLTVFLTTWLRYFLKTFVFSDFVCVGHSAWAPEGLIARSHDLLTICCKMSNWISAIISISSITKRSAGLRGKCLRHISHLKKKAFLWQKIPSIQKVIITAFAIVRRNHRDRILDKVIRGPCSAVHWWQIYPGEATSGWPPHKTLLHWPLHFTVL